MNKSTTLYALSLVAIIFIVYTQCVRQGSAPQETHRLSDLARRALKEPVSADVIKVPLHCQEAFKALGAVSLDQALTEIGKWHSADVDACFHKRYSLSETSYASLAACHQFRQSSTNEPAKLQCERALLAYRAMLLAEIFESRVNYSSMELELLANKLMALVVRSGKLTERQIENWREMADAWIQRSPGNPQAYKTYLASYFSRNFDPRSIREGTEFYDVLTRGLKVAPMDVELLELKLLGDGFSSNAFEKVSDFVERYSDMAIGYYHLAAQFWRDNRESMAEEALKEALRIEPDNPRFKQALDVVRTTAGKNKKPFQIQLGVRFTFDQL